MRRCCVACKIQSPPNSMAMFCTNCGRSMSEGTTRCEFCGTTPSGEIGKPIKNGTPTSRADAVTGIDEVSAPIEFGKLVGRVLGGRYQLNEFIGSGGMGEIYRARRTHIGDTVAVKVLRSDVVNNEK